MKRIISSPDSICLLFNIFIFAAFRFVKAIPRNEREWHRDEFATDAACRIRRFTGGKSRLLHAADGAKASDDACANDAVLP